MPVSLQIFIIVQILFASPISVLALFVVAPSNSLLASVISEDISRTVNTFCGISYTTLAVLALSTALGRKPERQIRFLAIPLFTAGGFYLSSITGLRDPYGLIVLSLITIYMEIWIFALAYRCHVVMSARGMLLIMWVAVFSILGQVVRLQEVVFGSGAFYYLQYTWKTNFLLASNIALDVGVNVGYFLFAMEQSQRRAVTLESKSKELEHRKEELVALLDEYDRMTVRSTRLSSLNNMSLFTASIIHEISQPVQALKYAISNSKYLVKARDFDSLQESVEQIDGITDEIENIVVSLRSVMTKGRAGIEKISPEELILRALPLIGAECGRRGIIFETDIRGGGIRITANPTLFQRIFFNLVSNGIEALAAVNAQDKGLGVRVFVRPDEASFFLEVTSRGVGMASPPEALLSLETVGDTKKEDGMGLGLAFSNKILKSWGGELSAHVSHVESEPQTSFTIRIPVAERE